MDSVSQFVLGAAVGEVVLGKKLGNKAILWGGIAGTIPDLDVMFSPFLSEVDALAFHRGFSHSISFAILGAFAFAWLLNKAYQRNGKIDSDPPTLRSWQWMFFLAFFTHSLLDTFTMYGTQLLSPFTNYRFAISSISVADPIYTIPFIVCLIVVLFQNDFKKRRFWNYLGIGLSSAYLLFTVVNRQLIQKEYKQQLANQGIEYKKLIIGPTILNNVLWNATVETEENFLQAHYSIFDKSEISFRPIEKNHELLSDNMDDRAIRILRWFTKDFFNIIQREDGRLQMNDLRYGTFESNREDENAYIFRFILEKENGRYIVKKAKGGPEPGEEDAIFGSLWERIKGV